MRICRRSSPRPPNFAGRLVTLLGCAEGLETPKPDYRAQSLCSATLPGVCAVPQVGHLRMLMITPTMVAIAPTAVHTRLPRARRTFLSRYPRLNLFAHSWLLDESWCDHQWRLARESISSARTSALNAAEYTVPAGRTSGSGRDITPTVVVDILPSHLSPYSQ